jgi:hypothetical protein
LAVGSWQLAAGSFKLAVINLIANCKLATANFFTADCKLATANFFSNCQLQTVQFSSF